MLYGLIDRIALPAERANLQINRFLGLIPRLSERVGGAHTIAEWAYTVGLYQAIVHFLAGQRDRLDVLDLGCGVGRLGLAVAPLIGERGSYLGIDVSAKDIETARRLFTGHSRFSFAHLAHSNRTYAPDQARAFPPYPIADASVDIVTAQSVWTHLNEADAMFYFGELARTLRPAGKAIVTFFYLDDGYRESLTVQPIGSAPPGSEPQKK